MRGSMNHLKTFKADMTSYEAPRLDVGGGEWEASQELIRHYQDTESSGCDDVQESDDGSQHDDSESCGSEKDDGGFNENEELDDDPRFRALQTAEGTYTATLSTALLNDREVSHTSGTRCAEPLVACKLTECCVCGTLAMYTCPGCGRRTCSMICVRVHKTDFQCTGVRDVTLKVPLSEFTDQQLQRDYHFLENCRRVIGNVERGFPRTSWRYNYKALPPPLHALREAARRRGVICQITSEGMHKREENTSRLDRKTNTVVWRCEFQFYTTDDGADVTTISTDWGSERHRLGDILKYCWATNPPLLCYHINRQYNRASKYVGGSTAKATKSSEGEVSDMTQATQQDSSIALLDAKVHDASATPLPAGVDAVSLAGVTKFVSDKVESNETHTPVAMVEPEATAATNESPSSAPAKLPALRAYEEMPPMPPIVPTTLQEAEKRDFVAAFLAQEKYVILSKAERLGSDARYFLLDPYDTLNENLRRLFFVNEFPVFVVVHASHLHRFTLVTEEDKEAIRSSFRPKKTQAPRERPPLRKRSDMEPEELERLSRVPCRRFLQSRCLLAEECPYWHCTPDDIPVCRSFLRSGHCDKGARCSFRHDADAVRVARKRQRDGLSEHGSPMGGGCTGRGFGFSRQQGDGRGRGGVASAFRSGAYRPCRRTE
ncbi:hypothetical protein JKF63_03447 [Porcisia hertigi]|uniref:Uncharacterized protein n=1 Tax=Porcisia hertigi TaxID=2761500 RepID=A0A836IB77_9TRYP|nr:hypothetical protein JKF63_03447 [Porcisia hertigi]